MITKNILKTNKTINTIVDKSGIDETFEGENGITAYPNPAKNTLYLKLNKDNPVIKEILIYNVYGQPVAGFRMIENELKVLDISNLAVGLYIIKSADGRFLKKLMIAR